MTHTALAGPSRTARAGLTFVNRLLTQGAGLVVTFFVTPTILLALGIELYGALRIIQRSMDFLSLGHLRPMSLLKLTLARSQGEANDPDKREQVGAALSVWALMLPLLALAGGVAVWFAPAICGTSADYDAAVRQGMAVAALVVALTPLLDLPGSVLKGLNLEYKVLGLNGMAAIFGALMTWLAAAAGLGLPWVVAAFSSQILLTTAVAQVVVRREVAWFGLARPTVRRLRAFLGLNLWNLAQTFLKYLYQSGDLIFVGMVFGAKAAGIYALTAAAMQRLIGPLIEFFLGGLPGIGDLLGRGETARVAEVRLEMLRSMLAACAVLGTGVLLLNQPFLALWVGAENYGGELLTLMIVLAATADGIGRIDAMVLDSALLLKHKTFALAGSVAVYAGTFLALVPVLEVSALPAARVLALAVLLACYWLLLRPVLGQPAPRLALAVLRPVLPAGLLLAAAAAGSGMLRPADWLGFFVLAGGIFAAASVYGWLLVLGGEDRARLRRRLARLIGRKA